MRGRPGRQQAGLLLLVGLLLVRVLLPGPREEPTPAESRRIGWQPAAEAVALAGDVHERVNAERAARGARPVAWDEDLAELARGWSERMIAEGYEHSPDAYRTHPRFTGGHGENIAMGFMSSAELHLGWMESDAHRENILHPEWDAVGVGVVCRNDGALWATQVFARYRPGPPVAAVDTGPSPVVADYGKGLSCPRSLRYRLTPG